MSTTMYTQGDYLEKNPTWHVEDSPWKAKQIMKMMSRNKIKSKTICEIGCGAGEILVQLQNSLDKDHKFWGYDISPQAFELCKKRSNEGLQFVLGDLCEDDIFFDLVLIIDVIEHVEDYFTLLRNIKERSKYKILHIPLDISVQTVLLNRTFIEDRYSVGHIHVFTKEIALMILRDAGYQVIDYFYTGIGFEGHGKSIASYFTRWPRKLLFAINKDLTVRILGRYSLMVLAE